MLLCVCVRVCVHIVIVLLTQNGKCLAHFDMKVYSAVSKAVYLLSAVPLEKQVCLMYRTFIPLFFHYIHLPCVIASWPQSGCLLLKPYKTSDLQKAVKLPCQQQSTQFKILLVLSMNQDLPGLHCIYHRVACFFEGLIFLLFNYLLGG